MDRKTYAVIKRRCHVAAQRARGSLDPVLWREYERAKAERDRAFFEKGRLTLLDFIRDAS